MPIDRTNVKLVRRTEGEQMARWGKRRRDPRPLKSYGVYEGETLIGVVYQGMVTFDIKPKGSRIVTKRWESPRWRCEPAKGAIRGWWETRKGALEALLYHLENPS